ncbi:transcriptional regulator, MarR family [Streptococcus cristatus ATCC 51100]|uniref:Sugar-specific transcriptional regulator, TrmB family n=1 Tax=Streptococcus cristatus ATCC 51100 TaxID=889201 RepID=A0AAV3ECY7_STRCR|nr:zinc-dependent MarR family transcriptional regulator [Streptococcus cristatus]EFX52620.1 transcriptional regulator, MarR family [Streptococcus cristatus ATCC 51100]EGU66510.1 sugar-specific transcriptional regulator, TrmB family [Streptococcus cristatus ATCC 51100]KJQ61351.1 adc operon repressor AdcR [Streptococcus cristatus]KJQ61634.1 adc operon repressor AdcR [Streptococcus cristatus]QIP50157.1 MarR family transcriptional regulator [Streptococcus cristatus ATCC 51100]
MGHLAEKINHFLNEVILTAENQHEILVGSCTSDVQLTNTQEHILMLLSQESLTNSDLAKRLNVSQAAVTKAVKALVEQKMLETFKDKKDARVTFYRLTDLARPIAEEHQHHHVHTLETYQRLAEQFSSDEQEVIVKFLDGLIGEIGK